jgi:hypothetical protein
MRWSSETEGIPYLKKRFANGSRKFPLGILTYIPKLVQLLVQVNLHRRKQSRVFEQRAQKI